MTAPLPTGSVITSLGDGDGTGPAGTIEQRAAAAMPRNCGTHAPAGPVLTDAGPSDREWAFDLYSLFARGGDDERTYYLVFDGEPWSKSRTRVTRTGRVYQPQADRDAEAALRNRIRASGVEQFVGNVMIACRFYRSTFQRVDTDNLLKHVCDSATGVLWQDDSQVTFALGEIQLDAERPRTVLIVGNHSSTLVRGLDDIRECEICGAEFRRRKTSRPNRTCGSRECLGKARRNPKNWLTVPCRQCGKPFTRQSKETKFCSRACRYKAAEGPLSDCWQCGAKLAHNRGGRCRACWMADPNKGPLR